jgi:hypothetical protein
LFISSSCNTIMPITRNNKKRKEAVAPDVNEQIAAKQRELKELELQREKDEFQVINGVLESWHQKLQASKYRKEARFQLCIRGFAQGHYEYLGARVVRFCNYNESLWNIKCYIQSSPYDAEPMRYSADMAEALLPNDHPRTTTYMSRFGVRFDITDAQELAAVSREQAVLLAIETQLRSLRHTRSIGQVYSTESACEYWRDRQYMEANNKNDDKDEVGADEDLSLMPTRSHRAEALEDIRSRFESMIQAEIDASAL